MPNSIFGLKFETNVDGDVVIAFDTDRAPMWGNFFAKDGVDNPGNIEVFIYNNGLVDADSGNVLNFIAVPDTQSSFPGPDPDPVIPEPATIALLGLGLSGMAGLRRKARR